MKKRKKYEVFAEYITRKEQPVKENMFHDSVVTDEKIEELKDLYLELDEIEIPLTSDSMEFKFQQKLEDYKLKNTPGNSFRFVWKNLVELVFVNRGILKPAFVAAVFLFGIVIGFMANNNQQETGELIAELRDSQKLLTLTLLEQPSATARLKAVNLSETFEDADESVITALFTTLNNDENVNVRLAAIEVLFKYSEQSEVRKGFVESITNQDSPLVLLTLSKAMVILQEKSSVENLKNKLNNGSLDETVKNRINENIQKII